MWVLIWILLSIFILGVSAWSYQILFRQKAAWRTFAAKNGLTYQNGPTFLSSPIVSGNIGPYGFGLFSEERQTNDARGQRFNTVLELALRKGLPTTGAIGTAAMAPFIEQQSGMTQTVSIADPDWDPQWSIRTMDAKALEPYLTPARRDVLKKIFRMKIMAALFVFDENDAVLRIETADPLQNAEKIEKILKGMTQQLEILGPGTGAAPVAPASDQPAQ